MYRPVSTTTNLDEGTHTDTFMVDKDTNNLVELFDHYTKETLLSIPSSLIMHVEYADDRCILKMNLDGEFDYYIYVYKPYPSESTGLYCKSYNFVAVDKQLTPDRETIDERVARISAYTPNCLIDVRESLTKAFLTVSMTTQLNKIKIADKQDVVEPKSEKPKKAWDFELV